MDSPSCESNPPGLRASRGGCLCAGQDLRRVDQTFALPLMVEL